MGIPGDGSHEDDKSFSVSLTNPAGAVIGDGTGTGTITNDDGPPTISIGDVTVTEGNTGTVDANFVVSVSPVSGKPITVQYSTGTGTATAGTDYVAVQDQTLTIPAGQPSGTIAIKVNGDTVAESTESFPVNIFNATNATISDGSGTATITDNDAAPVASIEDFTTPEGDANLTLDVKVTLGSVSQQPLTFDYRTIDNSATVADYDLLGGSVTFPANQTERTIPLVIKGDVLDEPSETFLIQIVRPADGAVVDTTTVTITDNDRKSMLSVGDAEANEGSAGASSTMTFKVTLAPASARPVNVGWFTENGTGTAGSDYTAAGGSLAFAPFETEKEVSITVLGDDVNEENETVIVKLVVPAEGALIADPQGQGTIIDKNAPPSLSISDTVASESGGAKFEVELAGTTLRTVTVAFGTTDGTAREPGDYVARSGTLTFAPGEKKKTVEVTVVDDVVSEPVETFSVGLGNAANATITKSRGTATIEASDQVTPSGAPVNRNPTTPQATPKVLLPKMVLAPRIVNVTTAGIARLFLTCAKASPITCRGTVTLQTTGKPAVKIGTKIFAVKKGKKQTLGVKLSPKARKLLRQRPTLRARVVVVVKTSAKSMRVVPGVITLKAAPKPKPKTTSRPAP